MYYYCECNKACEIDEYLDNCSCEKRLFAKIVLACEDQKLNTTEASLEDKKVTCAKIVSSFTLFHSHYFIHTISFTLFHSRYFIHTISFTLFHSHYFIHTISFTLFHLHYFIHTISFTLFHSHYFIHTISSAIICLLFLVVIFISCYYCYTKHWE